MTRVKKCGYYASRKKESFSRRWRLPAQRLPRWFWPAAFLVLMWILGLTQAWPQENGLSSRSRNDDLTTWEKLSGEYRKALHEQSTRLQQALTELETSKASSQKLTSLLDESLKANERLKSFNSQIAERMQERDEDLARSYEDIDRLEGQRLRLILAVIVLGAALAGIFVLKFVVRK